MTTDVDFENMRLRTSGDPCLSKKSIECNLPRTTLDILLLSMYRIMKEKNGLGISAPQVGVNVRVIIVNELVMVNPIVVRIWGNRIAGDEGCLSYPCTIKNMLRHKFIKISYEDANGEPQLRKFKFFDASIVQHELDHLDGITIEGD